MGKLSGLFANICSVPSNISSVLSGLIKRLFEQHRAAISCRCWLYQTSGQGKTDKSWNIIINIDFQ